MHKIPHHLLSRKANMALRVMFNAQQSEANAVAECLNDIATDGGNIGEVSDEFMLIVAEEIKGWAEYFITELKKEG